MATDGVVVGFVALVVVVVEVFGDNLTTVAVLVSTVFGAVGKDGDDNA